MMQSATSGNFIYYILFGIAIFVICREILCWYWKINRIVELLENIEENTRPKGVAHTEVIKEDNIDYSDPLWMFKKKKFLKK